MVATINIHSIYQSGYRDGVDYIMLKRKGVKLPSDVW